VAPYNTLYGNCGYSYFYLSGGYNSRYYFNTGFHVNTAAVDYDWHVDIDGPYGYDRDWYFGGGLALRHDWSSGTRSAYVDDSGWYAGDVQSGLAVLVNREGLHSPSFEQGLRVPAPAGAESLLRSPRRAGGRARALVPGGGLPDLWAAALL
jgi:hypothetical protein